MKEAREPQRMTASQQLDTEQIKTGALQDAIFNSAYFSSIATDERGVIQIFNVGAERMLGYAAVDVVNRITPADISDPQELITRAATLSAELETPITPGFEALVFKASRGIEDMYELTYVRKNGSRFPAMVSVTALRDAEERIIGYLLIGTDNTARKEVEAAQELLDQQLRDQQFYTRSLIESNIDALMMTDPDGNISDVNQQMMALTGRTREELIGTPCRNFFTDPASADAAIGRVITEHKVSDYELTVRARNGLETVVSYNAATFHDGDGRLGGVFAAARDMTDRKRIERSLQEKNVELEHASRMKSEFLAMMSHELRTPLNAVIGFSEALKDGLVGQMSDSQQEYIGDIFTSGQHLLSLINDILDLSKVEAGMMALEPEEVDVGGLVSGALSIVREKAAARNIGLDLDIGEDLGVSQLDVRKTRQIVYNLLSNAVKFSEHGGRVALQARRVPPGDVGMLHGTWPVHSFPLAESDLDEFLEISVTDGGRGISRDDMGKLFQAFSQVDSSLARKFEGTGLGLAMVKQMAELLGGTVAVASQEGEGARFTAWLPLRTLGQVDVAGPQRMGPKPADGSARVALVIEEDEGSADLLRLLLEAEDFTVLHAVSAEAALVAAFEQPLDLITLDVRLPGIGGWECLARIREDPRLAHVPVVIISGAGSSNTAMTLGAVAILQKPISRTQLRVSLANLGLHEAHNRTRSVLVVDDDPKAVELIAAFLPSPAYAIVRAYGGSEAIILAQRLRPDLILLDLMMPDVNGFDVFEALQGHSETARIPILVVTAKDITAEDRKVLNASDKVVRIIEKAGFNRQGFMAEVRRALPQR
jgi:PAS domain S-box-containing protein